MQTAPRKINEEKLAAELQSRKDDLDCIGLQSVHQWGYRIGEPEKGEDRTAWDLVQDYKQLHEAQNQLDAAIKRYDKIKIWLIQHHAFYGSFLCQMDVGFTVDTYLACTNGEEILFNPVTFNELADEEIKFMLIHEVQHIAHLHSFRMRERESQLWNIACDYAINDLIKREKDMTMHPSGCWSEKYIDMSPEQIYTLLEQEISQMEPQPEEGEGDGAQGTCQTCGGEGPQDKGDGSEKPSSCPECGKTGDEDQAGSAQQPGKEEGRITRYLGLAVDWLHGDLRPAPTDITAMERNELEAKVKRMTTEAAFHARAMGQDEIISKQVIDSMAAKTSWQISMQSFVEAAIEKDDYTWARPRRRYIPFDMYLPDLGGSRPPKAIAVVVDVSGSVAESTLKKFLDELSALVYANQSITYHFYAVDTRIQSKMKFGIEDMPIQWEVRAGGGTNFRPAFNDIKENDIQISGLIYFTDMYCYDYPSEEPVFPVMWLNWGSIDFNEDGTVEEGYHGYGRSYSPPFGTVINMRD